VLLDLYETPRQIVVDDVPAMSVKVDALAHRDVQMSSSGSRG
jgi:hypothetical protein